VLVQLQPGEPKAGVAQEIDRGKHLSAVTEQQEKDHLTVFVIEKMQRQLGMFMVRGATRVDALVEATCRSFRERSSAWRPKRIGQDLGWRMGRWPGAIFATIAFLLPALALMTVRQPPCWRCPMHRGYAER
jgi:hypothetical protein